MTLAELNTILTGISGYTNKVTYYAWPENEAPALPFIVYTETRSDNLMADGIVYHNGKAVNVELYTEYKSPTDEALVEAALAGAGIPWESETDYIDSEKCWMTTYSIEV